MIKWDIFKDFITRWSKLQITDDEFYKFLTTAELSPPDRRLADIFIKQHDCGEWSHDIYHRARVR